MQVNYSLSHKTMNTRENLWNVYCFVTNQMGHEPAKDNHETMALVSCDLIQNNELRFFLLQRLPNHMHMLAYLCFG